MLLFCNLIVASCNISLVMLIQIALLWEDLSASVFVNGQGQFFWIEIFHGQMRVSWVRRDNSIEALVFLMVYVDWIHLRAKLFLRSILSIFRCDLCLFMDHYFGH